MSVCDVADALETKGINLQRARYGKRQHTLRDRREDREVDTESQRAKVRQIETRTYASFQLGQIPPMCLFVA